MTASTRRPRQPGPNREGANRQRPRQELVERPPFGAIAYPEQLPITGRREDLLAAIRDNQVVIVAGETGSGKSTQLPKLCLELGRGTRGRIGHTQPRRVAARTIAERIASELGTELGTAVGYTVRFTDRVGAATYIKVMTDGILLAEIQRDRTLSSYDTLIIDEAHERSLNIDFLLGYLKQLLPRRPDLKLIVTSATIDTARFSEHFDGAPVIEVTGRTFPVEVRYRPFGISGDVPGRDNDNDDDSDSDSDSDSDNDSDNDSDDPDHAGTVAVGRRPAASVRIDDDRDQVQAVCDAVDELGRIGPGDVLVFLSGEREIHDTADALRRLDRPGLEVLPLYARLSAAEQHRIFEPHAGRRVVLSTNVAETSLTVPGVRYVVDTGAARISRYSHRLKVQRLPIEAVSQASANQRAGRCGRVAPGVCIRLYGQDDFASRPAFTEPEILRTNLASVILQMTAIGLGDVAAFPFLDAPDSRAIRDGVLLLEELGALPPDQPADQRRLTPVGKRLAQLPIDPRLARMVVEAERHGCVREVMIIAAALSIQDPRERPADKRQAADEAHHRHQVEGSDFLTLVKLWDHLREQQQALTSSQFRKACRAEFLNYLRVREWQDLFRQLREATAGVGIRPGTDNGHPDRVHQAVLAGLLSHIGMREGESREFRGPRNAKFMIAPGSVVAKRPPKWVMAAELVETSRLWGRVAAAMQPEWAEQVGGHLVKRSYGEPRWDVRGGRAVTSERVMLYGLPLVAARTVGYDRVDPVASRAIFIRNAMVDGLWAPRHAFVRENASLIDQVRALGARMRRWDIADDETIFRFFDQRVGAEVVSTRHFDQWWKRERGEDPRLLNLTVEVLTGGAAGSTTAYPDTWRQGEMTFDVTYRFEPGEIGDGVTVHIPIAVLNQVTADGFDWQVPGFREELLDALVRTLPKPVRRHLTPLSEAARQAAAAMPSPTGASLTAELATVLTGLAGERVASSAFDIRAVPDHLRITFSVESDDGAPIAVGKDLDAVRALVGGRIRAAIADAAPSIERAGIVAWDFGDLPDRVDTVRGDHTIIGYPALLDNGDSVAIRVFSKPEIQAKIMPSGVRRLLLLAVPVGSKGLERDVSNAVRLAIGGNRSQTTLATLIADCVTAAADSLIAEAGGPPRTAAGFSTLVTAARSQLADRAARALRAAGAIFVAANEADARARRLIAPALQTSVTDARAHLDHLVRPGFVAAAGTARLGDVLRYVRGVERRLERLPEDPMRDVRHVTEARAVERRYSTTLAAIAPSAVTDEVLDIAWMLEELRVSLFAQSLGTARSVSVQRIDRAIAALAGVVAGSR